MADAIKKVDGVEEVKNGIVPAGDALDIESTASKRAGGRRPRAVTKALNDLLSGNVTTQVPAGPEADRCARLDPPRTCGTTVPDLEELLLRAPDGHLFPLNRVATLHDRTGEPEITREDLKRMVAVTGRISGRDLGSTIARREKGAR